MQGVCGVFPHFTKSSDWGNTVSLCDYLSLFLLHCYIWRHCWDWIVRVASIIWSWLSHHSSLPIFTPMCGNVQQRWCVSSVRQFISSFSNQAAVVCRQHAAVHRQLQRSSSGGVSAVCGSSSAGCSGSVINCSVPAVAIWYNSSGRNCDTWRWMCNTNLHTASYSEERPNWVLKPR